MASNTLSDSPVEKSAQHSAPDFVSVEEKRDVLSDQHVEKFDADDGNLHYDEVDVEPEIHLRTWIACVAMFMLNMVQVVALQGPPAVVSI
jgi:hypothetical protein